MNETLAVSSRDELITHVTRLCESVAKGEEIENPTIERFLEALAAWLDDVRDEAEPSWSLVARALSAALIYE
ncbi:DUF7660 family protein [Actinomadura rudentiformis]|uniref:DUF7660 domain-containing protein n=1 Tax=Actinomadura rudentiformis TaxID=359158 RepID=A0A6H9YSL0_9ACTN|nr:hypothetical protein [Actinomadura rudentiformis]KAB2348443.1 hypothetical protein F8566_16800 [Actinomadura rudentiformis]